MTATTETGRRRVNAPAPAQEVVAPMQETPYGFCECGCGQRTNLAIETRPKIGHVKGEPVRFINGHSRTRNRHPYYSVDVETGCWVWQRALYHDGYGRLGGRRAHRVYYERFKGPIPDGLVVDHLCGNPPCVNPEHLEAVHQRENMRRAGYTKLTMPEARAIRLEDGSVAEVAARYGVSITTVYAIKQGRAWKEAHKP